MQRFSRKSLLLAGPTWTVVVLRNIKLVLSPNLSKLFNRWKDEGEMLLKSMELFNCVPGDEHSYLSQYWPINLLSDSKLFEYIINQKVAEHLRRKNLLSDNQYGFRPAKHTVDVLTVIIPIIREALDKRPLTTEAVAETLQLWNSCQSSLNYQVLP